MAKRGFYSKRYTNILVNKRYKQFTDNIGSSSSESEEHENQVVLENFTRNVDEIRNDDNNVEEEEEEYVHQNEDANDDIPPSSDEEFTDEEPDEQLYEEDMDLDVEDIQEAIELQSNLAQDLAILISQSKVTRDFTDKLLRVLTNNGVENLPKSSKTLMKTPHSTIIPKQILPGEYIHFGIQNHFLNNNLRFLRTNDEISIDIGIDGLKVFNSSSLCLWPILGAVVNKPNVTPFLIGCYCGYKQPSCSELFLKDFADEVDKLQKEGILIDKNIPKKPFKIRLFSCDAPARAFVTGVKYHQAFDGCSKCDQKGIRRSNRTVYSTSKSIERTDLSYIERRDIAHHNQKFVNQRTVLENIGIGMVSQFPIDPMHLCDLGVMKKMIGYMMKHRSYGARIDQTKISERLLMKIKPNIPSEFTRDCRSLEHFSFWKATEFKQFLNYSGIVVLKGLVNDKIYYHFLLYHCSIRLLAQPLQDEGTIELADNMLKDFVKYFPTMYGASSVSHNVHNLLHLADCVRQFGPLSSFSAYKFECYMQQLKGNLHNSNKVLQQLRNRQLERQVLGVSNDTNKFGEFNVNPKQEKNSFCLMKTGESIKVLDIRMEDGEQIIYGVVCLNPTSFFDTPIDSAAIGILKYDTLETEIKKFSFHDRVSKYFRIPFEDEFILIPILHHSFNRFGY